MWLNDYMNHVTDKKKLSKLLQYIQDEEVPKTDFDVDDSGKLYACVTCIECEKDIRVVINRNKKLIKFNRQNFDRHMIRQHLHIKVDNYSQICL